MAAFLIHVELHHAHSTDYNMLYEQMEKQGFKRTAISEKTSAEHHLLHSEYRINVALQPATKNRSAQDATALYVDSLLMMALQATINESKKNGRTSYLTTSHTIVQYTGSIWFRNLELVK